jgi:antitoxin HicB
MKAKSYSFTVLFEPAEEGGHVATCPALPGLVTEGDTLDEARANAKDAIRGYLESLAKDGVQPPA